MGVLGGGFEEEGNCYKETPPPSFFAVSSSVSFGVSLLLITGDRDRSYLLLTIARSPCNLFIACGKIRRPGLQARPLRGQPLFHYSQAVLCLIFSALSLAVEWETSGSAVLSGGLATCLTAIFRLQAKNGEAFSLRRPTMKDLSAHLTATNSRMTHSEIQEAAA